MAHTYLYGGCAAQIISPYCSQICLRCDSSHVTLLCDIFSWFPLLQDEVQILSRGSQALRNLTLTASQQCLPTALTLQAIKVYSVVSVKLLSSHWHPCLCSCHSFPWTKHSPRFSSVQSLSHVRLFVTPWTAACQASLSITNSRSLLKLMSIESVMPSKHLILCRPLLPPSIFPSIRVFSNESALRIRWPKYWSFIFNISPSNEYPGLISFRTDWLDLLAVQGTLKTLLQHHSSKASVLQHSAFFRVQLLHP